MKDYGREFVGPLILQRVNELPDTDEPAPTLLVLAKENEDDEIYIGKSNKWEKLAYHKNCVGTSGTSGTNWEMALQFQLLKEILILNGLLMVDYVTVFVEQFLLQIKHCQQRHYQC